MRIDSSTLSLEAVASLFEKASQSLDPNDAAFLFATGKSELEVRDVLALYLHNQLEDGQHATREWKRHDLAVLDKKAHPLLILEGKSWAHSNPLSLSKLNIGDKSIRAGLEGDLRKIMETQESHPEVPSFITTILFSIELPTQRHLHKFVKYAPLHRSGMKANRDFDKLCSVGKGCLQDLLHNYGEFIWQPLWDGEYMGMRVKSEINILKPDYAKVRKIVKPIAKKEKKGN